MDNLASLREILLSELEQPVLRQVDALVRAIRNDHDSVGAILFYGSGFWRPPEPDTVFDFYVLIDKYREFNRRRSHAIFGHLLPPNVYFLKTEHARCKFAVMRFDQFERAAAGQSMHSQIWSRFAQPCRLVYVRDEYVRDRIVAALVRAVVSFHEQTLPLLKDAQPSAHDIWVCGLARTYGNEWRSEGAARAEQLYSINRSPLDARTELALPLARPARAPVTAGLRHALAKSIYFLQLMKAVFTFEGGVDYALYKIERQSGLKLEASEFQRRHPLIAAWPLVWRAWRAGALR